MDFPYPNTNPPPRGGVAAMHKVIWVEKNAPYVTGCGRSITVHGFGVFEYIVSTSTIPVGEG